MPAAAARFEIPFVRQQRVSVLYRDDAQPLLPASCRLDGIRAPKG